MLERTEDLIKKMRAGQFVKNNGRVLRTINILRHRYERLGEIKYALEDLDEGNYLDCLNFLSEAGYIRLRDATGKMEVELADADYERLEAKVTEKGIRLLGGELRDKLVDA